MFDFNIMPFPYFTDVEKCNFLQRYVLVHCILYYELNESVIPDKQYDEAAKQLYNIMHQLEGFDSERTQYGYVFWDFVPDTGFDLYSKLNEKDRIWLRHLAFVVLKQYKKENKK